MAICSQNRDGRKEKGGEERREVNGLNLDFGRAYRDEKGRRVGTTLGTAL